MLQLSHYFCESPIVGVISWRAIHSKLNLGDIAVELLQDSPVSPGHNGWRVLECSTTKGPQNQGVNAIGYGNPKNFSASCLVYLQKLSVRNRDCRTCSRVHLVVRHLSQIRGGAADDINLPPILRAQPFRDAGIRFKNRDPRGIDTGIRVSCILMLLVETVELFL